jgi:hypothetical protein
MTDPMRKTCFGILADSVSEVVGNRSLVYIAVKQAALTGDISKFGNKVRWLRSRMAKSLLPTCRSCLAAPARFSEPLGLRSLMGLSSIEV